MTVDDIATLDLDPSSPQVLSVGTLSLTNASTIAGSDSLTISGLFTWSDSTLSLTGTTTAAGGIDLSSGGSSLVGGTLVNGPSSTVSSSGGDMPVSSGATIDNQGTWDFTGYGYLYGLAGGSPPQLTNEGTIETLAGASDGGIAMETTNTGTMASHGGTLYVGASAYVDMRVRAARPT